MQIEKFQNSSRIKTYQELGAGLFFFHQTERCGGAHVATFVEHEHVNMSRFVACGALHLVNSAQLGVRKNNTIVMQALPEGLAFHPVFQSRGRQEVQSVSKKINRLPFRHKSGEMTIAVVWMYPLSQARPFFLMLFHAPFELELTKCE
jgi:hypothetical protein